jgi:hypothetical protein
MKKETRSYVINRINLIQIRALRHTLQDAQNDGNLKFTEHRKIMENEFVVTAHKEFHLAISDVLLDVMHKVKVVK